MLKEEKRQSIDGDAEADLEPLNQQIKEHEEVFEISLN